MPHLIITSGWVVSGERQALKSKVRLPTLTERWSSEMMTVSRSPRESSVLFRGRTRTTTLTADPPPPPPPLLVPLTDPPALSTL